MREPLRQDDTFLVDVASASTGGDLHVWWLGQSGFLVQWQKHRFLFDPYLSDSLTTKYATTDKPHVRMTRRVIDPQRLEGIEAVTSTHNHTDHLDAETLGPLWQANPQMTLVLPRANRSFAAERLQRDAETFAGLNDGESVRVGPFTIHGVPAAHETLERDEQGDCRFMGFVLQAGPWTVYHSGDTVRYDGMLEALAPFTIDLALLPINGRLPERRVSGNLWGDEAAALAHDIGARHVIPHHYDMFEFNTVTPDAFIRAATDLGVSHTILQNGERFTLT